MDHPWALCSTQTHKTHCSEKSHVVIGVVSFSAKPILSPKDNTEMIFLWVHTCIITCAASQIYKFLLMRILFLNRGLSCKERKPSPLHFTFLERVMPGITPGNLCEEQYHHVILSFVVLVQEAL
jgi:hypothetical protein